MTYETAVQLVADDQRDSYPDMTDAEAIEHARQTVSVDTPPAPGAVTLTVPAFTERMRELITEVIDRQPDHGSPERLLAETMADLDQALQLAEAYRIVLTEH